jgi:hypothetical protein
MHCITGRPKDPVRIVDLNGINSGYCVGTQTPDGGIVLPRRLRVYAVRASTVTKERACTSKVQGLPSLFGCPIDRPRQGKHYIQSLLHISL